VPLPVVPAPFEGEWLGHWLFRIADFYGMPLVSFLERILGSSTPPPGICWWHRLKDMGCSLQAVSDYVRQPVDTLLTMEFALIPLRFYDVIERSYCPRCLVDDCQSGTVPHWRSHWLDLANTWCHRHQTPLEVATFLPRIVRRTYAFQVNCLQDEAVRPPLAPDTLPVSWRTVLARQAQRHADAIGRHAPSQRSILVELTERLAGLVLELCRYDECQDDLARLIGAPYPDRLRLPRPSPRSARPEPGSRDSVRRIRTAYVRSWLLGVVASIALVKPQADASIGRTLLRDWLWRHLFAYHAPALREAFAPALWAGLITPWPELQAWQPPSSHGGWFKPLDGNIRCRT
jgi:hypothetical protein